MKVLKLNDILKLNIKEKQKIEDIFNEENTYYNTKLIKIDNQINKLLKHNNKYYYLFIYKDKKIIAKLRFYIKKIIDKILLGRFIYKNDTYCFIQQVFVSNRYRQKGLCSIMLKYLDNKVRYKKVLAVEKENIKAIKCYKKNKFKNIKFEYDNKMVNEWKLNDIIINDEYLLIK
tara:strand:+ start:2786 stop:3307 length:522 start_codon:yes stop_codon:yes gene_type:complete